MQELHKLKEGNNRKFKIIQYGTRWMTSRIPLDWDNKKLKEVVRFRQGLQIAKVERYRQGGKNRIKLIKVMDFGPDSVSDEYIDIPPQSRSVVCNKDDILIARTGTLGLVLTNVEGVFHNNTFALDYDRNILDKMFFYYFLKAPHVQLFIQIISTRTSQSDLTHREFSRLTVFIPPMKEQQKIASILSKVDELIQKTEQANEQTQKLKKGLMQRLLTKGIGHTKFKKVKLQFSFLQQVFPETWEIILLKDLSVDGLSNGIFKKREEFGKGVPIVNVSDLFYENDIDLSRLERVDVTESELRAFGIRQGDVFFCRSSLVMEGIGRSNIVNQLSEPAVFECHVMKLRPNISKVNPKFLAYFLQSKLARDFLFAIAMTLTMTTIRQPDLEKLPVLVPPLSEQQKIISVLSTLDLKNQTERKYINSLRNLKKGLMQKLLTGQIRVKV